MSSLLPTHLNKMV
jgi:hypothetical protein